jgi:tetratricopeptide (TPR) repeat protein
MIQEYARERLEESGEAPAIRRRHAEYFVQQAEYAEPEVRLAGFDYWYERFELELDNIRAVLEWSLHDGDLTLGVRLAGALCLFWYGKAPLVEGEHWTGQLLERLAEVPKIYHPQFLLSAAHVAKLHDLELAQRLYHQMLDVSREIGSKPHIAWALIFLGYTMQREPDAALAVVDEGLALFGELNHLPGIAQALNIVGEITRVNGNDEAAKQAYEQCLTICQRTGELRRICYMCYNLAYIAQHEGNHEHALELARRGLRLSYERQDKHEMANGFTVVAGSLAPLGQPERAARLLGACETAIERLGTIHHASDKPEVERIIAAVHGQLDDAAFQEAWAIGRTMTLEQAMADALGE